MPDTLQQDFFTTTAWLKLENRKPPAAMHDPAAAMAVEVDPPFHHHDPCVMTHSGLLGVFV